MEEHGALHSQTYIKEPAEANIEAYSSHFRSNIRAELHNWQLNIFLIIDIIIEHSSGGTTVDKLTREQRRDPAQNQGSWEPLFTAAQIAVNIVGFLALPLYDFGHIYELCGLTSPPTTCKKLPLVTHA